MFTHDDNKNYMSNRTTEQVQVQDTILVYVYVYLHFIMSQHNEQRF